MSRWISGAVSLVMLLSISAGAEELQSGVPFNAMEVAQVQFSMPSSSPVNFSPPSTNFPTFSIPSFSVPTPSVPRFSVIEFSRPAITETQRSIINFNRPDFVRPDVGAGGSRGTSAKALRAVPTPRVSSTARNARDRFTQGIHSLGNR